MPFATDCEGESRATKKLRLTDSVGGFALALAAWVAPAMPACAQGVTPPSTSDAAAADNGQTAVESVDDANGTDIVVTAQRRDERLQDVPIAISAITPVQAEKLSIRSVQDLQIVTPGLRYEAPYTYAQIFIRGVGTPFANPGLETSVAVYVDGVYLQRQIGTVFDLVDPATTQVLKGPQGTLYGRNATGGTILLNSADPTKTSEGRIAAEYGRFDRGQVDVMLNQPLSDTVQVRLAGRWLRDDGYIQNLATGRTLGGRESYTARGKLSWDATPSVNFLLAGEYYHDDADGAAVSLRAPAPLCLVCAIIPGNGPVTGRYQTNQEEDRNAITKSTLVYLKSSVDAGDYDIKGQIAYRRLTWRGFNEIDYTPVPFFIFNSRIGGNTYSAEGQIASKYSGPLNFLAGFSLSQDNAFFDAGLSGLAFGGLPELQNRARVKTKAASGFLEAYYDITPKLKLTAGGRYTAERKSINTANLPPAPLVFGSTGFSDSVTFERFTPRLVLMQETDIGNFYASYTQGFKSGGYNTPAFVPLSAVEPEKIDNYEVGAKLRTADRRLGFNVALFHYKYRDLQVNVQDLANGSTFLENAGKARGYGVEADLTFAVTPELNLGAGGAYLDARYTDYQNAQITRPAASGVGFEAGKEDLSGTRLPRSPKFTAYLTASYEREFASGWTAGLSAVGNYTSRQLLTAGAGGPIRYNFQKAYTLVNVTGFVSPPGDALRVGFYVDNLTNARYFSNKDTTVYGFYGTFARPRTYGTRVSYSF